MPPRPRSKPATAAVSTSDEYGPGDGLVLDGYDPVLCVGLDDDGVLLRVGLHHSEPVKIARERLRKATHAEVTEFEETYARFLRVALSNGELRRPEPAFDGVLDSRD